ncbi:MAG: signal peptidase II [Candidatus Woesearchaeota archaeon]|jgi:signal peptidase II|nr:signal peptidase II [Candidatus Woesearchaeota archaeon]MDP7506173.1 signal peptidase II [Candidatus Woesearchaeota archaeon]|tara:strand:+ start:364 stop:789 length:426 start_codon:yes stop_codon:yes gene_type:complete
MKKYVVFLIAGIIVLVDQLTKLLVVGIDSVPVIKNVLHLTLVKNTGAVFGMMHGQNVILIWVSLIVIGFILFYLEDLTESKAGLVMTALVIGGAVGNLVDRIRVGYVIDFIDFRVWPVFNVADSAIMIGVIGLVLLSLKKN